MRPVSDSLPGTTHWILEQPVPASLLALALGNPISVLVKIYLQFRNNWQQIVHISTYPEPRRADRVRAYSREELKLSGIRKSTETSSNRRTGTVRRNNPTSQSRAPRPANQTKPPSDRVKLSGEKGGPSKSPIDFGQNFAAKSPAKLDLNGGVMKKGAEGDQVKQLQSMLNSKGAKLETDGKFGAKTEQALKEFQDKQQIKSDGIVGNQTLGKLNPSQEGERAQAEAAGAIPKPAAAPAAPVANPSEPKVGTPLDSIRKSEPLPTPKPGGPSGTFKSKGTGYFPENSAMEGGFKDRKGKSLQTLQDFLSGKSKYVSVAMDKNAKIPYGKGLHIAELDKKYAAELKKLGKEHIDFRVVDTGGAFTNKGTSRIDIATANRKASLDPTVNGPLTLKFQD